MTDFMDNIKTGLCSEQEGMGFLLKIGKKLNKEAFRRYNEIYKNTRKMFKHSSKITYFFIKEENRCNEEILTSVYGDRLVFIYDFRDFGKVGALGDLLREIRGENALVYIIREDRVIVSWHEGGFYVFNPGCDDIQLSKK